MDKATLAARIRQVHAVDRNAFDIYTDLAKRVEDADLKRLFEEIARDEKKHITLSESLLASLD